jgi:capsular exopolysaccharide synthesis family protein
LAIGDYLRALRRFWWIVLVATLLGAAIGYGTTFLTKPEYESTARLFVTTQSGTSVGDAYQNNLFSQERVVSYAGLATSEQVARRAVDQLKMPISPEQLRAKITATPVPKTVLLDIAVTDSDPAQAQTYANAVADQLVQLASELETSRRGGTPAAGAILLDDANYPTKAAGMSLLTTVALGAVGGFVVGVLAALVLGAMDSRLRARDAVDAVAPSKNLGNLVADPRRSDVAVTNLSDGGVAAERLRELRTNLQFARTPAGRKPQVIAVTSPSHGDGRSTTAIDLAATFAESGRPVLLVEGDLLNPTLTDALGLSEADRSRAATRGLGTALAGDHDAAAAVLPAPGGAPFALLPAGPSASSRRQLWGDENAGRLVEELRAAYDYVVVDTPPLTTCSDGAVVAALGDGAIVLARIGSTKSKALRAALQALDAASATLLGTVVTCEPGHKRELAGRPADDATRAIVTPRDGAADGSSKGLQSNGTGDEPTETIGSAGAHRMTGTKPEGR